LEPTRGWRGPLTEHRPGFCAPPGGARASGGGGVAWIEAWPSWAWWTSGGRVGGQPAGV